MQQGKGLNGIPSIIALIVVGVLLVVLLMRRQEDVPVPSPTPVAQEENIHLKTPDNSASLSVLPQKPQKPSPPSIAAQADLVPLSKVDSLALDKQLLRSASDKMLISNYFSRKYNLDPLTVLDHVDHAQDAARETGIDPLLLLAIISIESNFNPTVQSPAGAQGLMQVMTSIHANKFAPYGGSAAAFLPEANIRVGALIIKQAIALMGSLQGGLRFYVGAAHPSVSDGGFVAKVLNEYARQMDMLGGNGVGLLHNAMQADLTRSLPPIPAVQIPDEKTPAPQEPSLKQQTLPLNTNSLRLPAASTP